MGRLTGNRYQWNDRLFDITNVAPSGTVSFTLNDNARLIGQGTAPDQQLSTQIRFTVNARTEVTVDWLSTRAVCG